MSVKGRKNVLNVLKGVVMLVLIVVLTAGCGEITSVSTFGCTTTQSQTTEPTTAEKPTEPISTTTAKKPTEPTEPTKSQSIKQEEKLSYGIIKITDLEGAKLGENQPPFQVNLYSKASDAKGNPLPIKIGEESSRIIFLFQSQEGEKLHGITRGYSLEQNENLSNTIGKSLDIDDMVTCEIRIQKPDTVKNSIVIYEFSFNSEKDGCYKGYLAFEFQ